MASSDSTRLLIIEDVPQVAQYIRGLLNTQGSVKLLDVLTDGSKVIPQIQQLRPDVVLVDTEDALAVLVPALQQLRRACPLSAVIVLGHRRDDDELFHAIEAGAAAHVGAGEPCRPAVRDRPGADVPDRYRSGNQPDAGETPE